MEDWLNDPLKVFAKSKGYYKHRKPLLEKKKAQKWQSFHHATRLKLEGSVHFCTKLLGAAALPDDIGLSLLIHRERAWYAEIFFFQLCSAYDTLLQEINIVYGLDLSMKDVKWNRIEEKLQDKEDGLLTMMREQRGKGWFKKVRWYRNMAAHHNVIRTEETTAGWGEEAWNKNVHDVSMIYLNEETNEVDTEKVDECEHYLRYMVAHINNVWHEMDRMFKPN